MTVKLEDTFWLHFGTTSPSTGNATNADSTPVVTIEEDGTTLAYAATVVNSGVGLYRVAIVASAANGFEVGKRYAAWVAATVGGATGRDGLESWMVDTVDLGDTLSVPAAIKVGTASLLSNVNAVYVLDTSMMVSVKSALSNTLAILVSTSSLLSNVTNVDSDLVTVAGNVTTILAGTTSIAISVASLLSNVANVDSDLVTVAGNVTTILAGTTSAAIGIASILSNVAAVSVSTASLLSNVANVDFDLVAALTAIPANVMASVVEGTLTVEGALRIILAWSSGAVSVTGAIRTFMDLAGTTPRITGTEDANGQRSGVTVDGS